MYFECSFSGSFYRSLEMQRVSGHPSVSASALVCFDISLRVDGQEGRRCGFGVFEGITPKRATYATLHEVHAVKGAENFPPPAFFRQTAPRLDARRAAAAFGDGLDRHPDFPRHRKIS